MKSKLKYIGVALLSAMVLVACNKDKKPVEPQPEPEREPVTYYVTPTGDVTADGLSETTPTSFHTAISKVEAGDTILLKGGVYSYNARIQIQKDGAPNGYISVHPQSASDRVVFDFSEMEFNGNNRGIQVYGDYWHFENIEVTGAGDNGMYIAGSYNIVENCLFYNNRDTGLQIGRGYSHENSINEWPSFNLIKNCTSFGNYDDETFGENADGFAAKLTIGYGNVFDGCIAFRNSDDGWDLYAKEESGNIGTVVLYNCVSFENGFLPYPIEREDASGNKYQTYITRDGDGIGFKLGGSTMEGDVLLHNCLAFNNKLHGFGDNSNPGVINISNCSAINNCAGVDEEGNISSVRGVSGTQNKSNNFDLARDTKSYNAYYGLLSYINNQTGYNVNEGDSSYNADKFRGSAAYSIFQTSFSKKEVYKTYTTYEDATAYTNDATLSLGTEYEGLTDSIFASLESFNAKCTDVAHIADLRQFHTSLRNQDLSVNLKNHCKLVDTKLLTYAEGKPIGSNLSLTSASDYMHYDVLDAKDCETIEEIQVQFVYNALEVLGDEDAIFQDFEVSKLIFGCDIQWESSDSSILEVKNEEKNSVSSAIFSTIKVHTPKTESKVTLTATISYGKATKQKTFNVTIKGRNVVIGDMVSTGTKTIRVGIYGNFVEPRIYPLDGSSVTKTELPKELYDLVYTYRYATDANSQFHEVDKVYTSVPGVYEVTAKAILKSDPTSIGTYSYNVYIIDPNCSIDFKEGEESLVALNNNGFTISGKLSNSFGDIYALASKTPLELTREELLAHPDVQKAEIMTDSIVANFIADNATGEIYYIYYLISNKNKTNEDATLYSTQTEIITIETKEEFNSLASKGKKDSETPTPTTIYSLANDLDFTDYTWKIPSKTDAKAFSGLFNGNGHTISNISITGSSADKNINVFFKISNGTVMNVHFDHILLNNTNTASGKIVGVIGDMQGGYLYNIKLTNVSARGRESVGALVGQVTGKENYISQCSLVNPIPEKIEDNEYIISAVNKYAGGIVGNGQKNDDQSDFKLVISNCMVKAIIGDGNDAGGNTGGILGRVKNDLTLYSTTVDHCYFQGIIVAKGNYNAGIIGDFDNGAGTTTIHHNYADVSFMFAGTYLNAEEAKLLGTTQQYAHKNTNPIVGRAVSSASGSYITSENYGTWAEYYNQVIKSTSTVFDLSDFDEETGEFNAWNMNKYFVETTLGLDIEKVWSFNEETLDLSLR